MNKLKSRVGRMPVRTWSHSGVNDRDIVFIYPESGYKKNNSSYITMPEKVQMNRKFDGVFTLNDDTGILTSPEIRSFVDEHNSSRYYFKIPQGYNSDDPVLITFEINEENPVLTDDIIIEAGKNSTSTVIIKYISQGGGTFEHCARTRIIAYEGAQVTLIKAQLLNESSSHTDMVRGVAYKDAHIHVILTEIGASEPISDCNLLLKEEEASADLEVLYLGEGTRSLDLSHRIEYRGRKTQGNIRARGVLMNKSKKIFRDTLDFVSGATGSKGREEENVLMLDDEVRNISVPILLCGEDDVQGEHAVSSGRPDDNLMFYLMSRGISQVDAKILLAQSAFACILDEVPDETLKVEILKRVHESIMRGRETF